MNTNDDLGFFKAFISVGWLFSILGVMIFVAFNFGYRRGVKKEKESVYYTQNNKLQNCQKLIVGIKE